MPLTSLRGHREIAPSAARRELATRPSHAYLFSGPRGVGKALVAQRLRPWPPVRAIAGREFLLHDPADVPMRAGSAD